MVAWAAGVMVPLTEAGRSLTRLTLPADHPDLPGLRPRVEVHAELAAQVVLEPVAPPLRRRRLELDDVQREAGGAQAVPEVPPVHAHVVLLAEARQPLGGVGDRRVLLRGL